MGGTLSGGVTRMLDGTFAPQGSFVFVPGGELHQVLNSRTGHGTVIGHWEIRNTNQIGTPDRAYELLIWDNAYTLIFPYTITNPVVKGAAKVAAKKTGAGTGVGSGAVTYLSATPLGAKTPAIRAIGTAVTTAEALQIVISAAIGGSSSYSIHPVSGVRIDSAGFPVFDSKFNAMLDSSLYTVSDFLQFKNATQQLHNAIQLDSSLRHQFTGHVNTERQLDQISRGIRPEGYTWHHHQDSGILQLVDSTLHQQTGHIGGRSIWGGGATNR
ncbi:MAG: HNH endonuclease, partial [Candidatus Bathyarchaeota archaeon]|nr:HNH endonuclease [Candidatus Termitimicrobium sp.]